MLALLLLASAAPAEPDDADPRVKEAVGRGLAYLARRQNSIGSWNDRVGYSFQGELYGSDAESLYATSLACMAFAAAGHVPGRGKYGRQVSRGVGWIMSKIREDGYITHAGSRMYDHALATLCLAEMCGMTQRDEIKLVVKRAIWMAADSQNREGGWRHQPIPIDADLSVTALMIQGMRAARNAGIVVPLETVERARRFVTNCGSRYGYAYQPVWDYDAHSHRVTFAMTAGGIVSMHCLGEYDTPAVRAAIEALASWRGRSDPPGRLHYYFAHYLAAQAMHVAGPERWAAYFPRVRDEILEEQKTDGHWDDEVGVHYATSMACLILQADTEYLTIFQK